MQETTCSIVHVAQVSPFSCYIFSFILTNNGNLAPGMLDFVQQTFANALTMSQAAYDATSQTPLNSGVQNIFTSLVNIQDPVVLTTPAEFATRKFCFIVRIFCRSVADQFVGKKYLVLVE